MSRALAILKWVPPLVLLHLDGVDSCGRGVLPVR
jgi:hypothetical protein